MYDRYHFPSTFVHYFGRTGAEVATATPTMLDNFWTEMITNITGVKKFKVTSFNICVLSNVGHIYTLQDHILFLFPFLSFLE